MVAEAVSTVATRADVRHVLSQRCTAYVLLWSTERQTEAVEWIASNLSWTGRTPTTEPPEWTTGEDRESLLLSLYLTQRPELWRHAAPARTKYDFRRRIHALVRRAMPSAAPHHRVYVAAAFLDALDEGKRSPRLRDLPPKVAERAFQVWRRVEAVEGGRP